MSKALRVSIGALALAAVLATATYAATRTIPVNEPDKVIQTVVDLPGDRGALESALQAQSPVTYKVLVIDGTEGEDRTDYLDRVADEWGQPGANTLLLVVYAEGNYDIRFYMGALFGQNNVSVDEMLQMVRTHYLTKARVGDPAGGLADLIQVVDGRIANGPAPAQEAGAQVPVTEAEQTEIGHQVLLEYLARYQAEDTPTEYRIKEFRIDASKLTLRERGEDWLEFMVIFDLLPEDTEAVAWMAGSGERGEDGWILSKTMFLKATFADGVWELAK